MNPLETEDKSGDLPLKQIRTFQGDVADALGRQKESLVSIQRLEHARTGAANPTLEHAKSRKEVFFLSLGSIVLLGLALGGGWYTYSEFVERSTTPPIGTPDNRFLSPNNEKTIIATEKLRSDFINTLVGARAETTGGELRHIVLRKPGETENPLLTTLEFLDILESRAPSTLVRAFDPLFMFGAYGQSGFLIIKLVSFENAYAGMLVWEKDLARDLSPLFRTAELLRAAPLATTSTSTIATSTNPTGASSTSTPPAPLEKQLEFSDISDRNKDIRAIIVGEQPVFLYSFFDNNFVIITDDLDTLRVLIDRLNLEKLSR